MPGKDKLDAVDPGQGQAREQTTALSKHTRFA